MADVDGGEVVDNAAASRFELTVDGQTAELVYRLEPPVLELVHTGVPTRWRARASAAGWSAAARRGRRAGRAHHRPDLRRSPAAGCAGIPRSRPG